MASVVKSRHSQAHWSGNTLWVLGRHGGGILGAIWVAARGSRKGAGEPSILAGRRCRYYLPATRARRHIGIVSIGGSTKVPNLSRRRLDWCDIDRGIAWHIYSSWPRKVINDSATYQCRNKPGTSPPPAATMAPTTTMTPTAAMTGTTVSVGRSD